MKNVRKAVVLLVAILAIVVFTRNVNAAAISTNSTNKTNTTNSASNTANNTSEPGNTNTAQNTYQPINTSNAAENIPKTGIEDSYFNFALILLLTLVLGTFSLVQYNKIIKKDQE